MSEIVNEYEPWIALGKTETEYWTMRYMEQRQENASLRSRLEEAEKKALTFENMLVDEQTERSMYEEGHKQARTDLAATKQKLEEAEKELAQLQRSFKRGMEINDRVVNENTALHAECARLKRGSVRYRTVAGLLDDAVERISLRSTMLQTQRLARIFNYLAIRAARLSEAGYD